jgi:hypothetical protein
MDYLGVILEKGITCMDPVKIAGIKKKIGLCPPELRTFAPFWASANFTNLLFKDSHT